VVFLIGASANNFLHVLKSFANLGGRRGMKHMLKYLTEHPEKRLVRYEMGFPTIVQYWRARSKTSRRSLAIRTTRISNRGATTGVASASRIERVSGTRRSWSVLASGRPSAGRHPGRPSSTEEGERARRGADESVVVAEDPGLEVHDATAPLDHRCCGRQRSSDRRPDEPQ